VRKNWLVFDSALKIHQSAVLKASYEFAADFGHAATHRLWKYLEAWRVLQDDIIFGEDEVDNTLYMMHAGRATAFTSKGDEYRRLHTITRGWFNTECLIENLPCSYSIVADQACDLVVISEASLAAMEANEPDLLVIIQRKILLMESLLRQRLKREVTAVDLAATQYRYQQQQQQKRYRQRRQQRQQRSLQRKSRWQSLTPLAESPDRPQTPHQLQHSSSAASTHDYPPPQPQQGVQRHRSSTFLRGYARVQSHSSAQPSFTLNNEVEAGWLLHDRHHLHFSFFHALFHQAHVEGEPGENRVPSRPQCAWYPNECTAGMHPATQARPRLSASMRHEAEETFIQHSSAGAEFDLILHRAEAQLLLRPRSRSWTQQQCTSSRVAPDGNAITLSATIERLLRTAELPVESLHLAVKDLGLYPTEQELKQCCEFVALQRREGPKQCDDTADSAQECAVEPPEPIRLESGDTLDFQEFLQVVEGFTLDHLNVNERSSLYDLYEEHASIDGRLYRGGLERLMASIGHPMDDDELEVILGEWEDEGRKIGTTGECSLSFGGFLSMMSVYLKRESVAEQMELDFLKFAGVLDIIEGDVNSGLLAHIANDNSYTLPAATIDWLYQILDSSPEDLAITAPSIRELYLRRQGTVLDLSVAQDMVFDAGDGEGASVCIEEFSQAIKQVSRSEIILNGERALRRSRLRRIRTLAVPQRSAQEEEQEEHEDRGEAGAGAVWGGRPNATAATRRRGWTLPPENVGSYNEGSPRAALRHYTSTVRLRLRPSSQGTLPEDSSKDNASSSGGSDGDGNSHIHNNTSPQNNGGQKSKIKESMI